jgi:hypothetical protein
MGVDKGFIRAKCCKIIRDNPHSQKFSRLQWFIDYLAKSYIYDDRLGDIVDHDKTTGTEKEYNTRTANLFQTGMGICQDFTNGLSYLANMDKIQCADLYCQISERIWDTKYICGHAVNFIPRGVFGQSLFIDMNGVKYGYKYGYDQYSNENDEVFIYKMRYNCAALADVKKAYRQKGWQIDKILPAQRGISPHFLMHDHWARSHGNFDKLHQSIFNCTYEKSNIGLRVDAIDK